MYEDFAPESQSVMGMADCEVRQLRKPAIGSEHFLIALSRSKTGVAFKVLVSLGLDADRARSVVEQVTGRGSDIVEEIPFTPKAKLIVENARHEADQLHDK